MSRCGYWLCPRCSVRNQKSLRRKLWSVVKSQRSLVLWTSTVERSASRPLADVWDDHEALMAAVIGDGWLTRRVAGYFRISEVVKSPEGWGPHSHTILVFQSELTDREVEMLRREIIDRTVAIAAQRGLRASAAGQDLQSIPRSDWWDVLAYITKQNTATGSLDPDGTRTPGTILRGAVAGDVDDIELLHELETASAGRRQRAPGGVFRERSNPAQK
jgi:hypothetical protein